MITEEQILEAERECYQGATVVGLCNFRKGVNWTLEQIEPIITELEMALLQSPKWISVTTPPKESGRYWVYVEDMGELGLSHFQCNASYCTKFNRWQENFIPLNVTHWTDLLPPPL